MHARDILTRMLSIPSIIFSYHTQHQAACHELTCFCRDDWENIFFHRNISHDDVIKWKIIPRYWPFVWGIHRRPVNCPHKGQWCGAFMFYLICGCINGWANNGGAADLRHHRAHYDDTVMTWPRDRACWYICPTSMSVSDNMCLVMPWKTNSTLSLLAKIMRRKE